MNTEQHTNIAQRTGRRQLMTAAALALAAFAAPAQAQNAGKSMTAPQVLQRAMDLFLAKDMKG